MRQQWITAKRTGASISVQAILRERRALGKSWWLHAHRSEPTGFPCRVSIRCSLLLRESRSQRYSSLAPAPDWGRAQCFEAQANDVCFVDAELCLRILQQRQIFLRETVRLGQRWGL